jgi:hypothetical protein
MIIIGNQQTISIKTEKKENKTESETKEGDKKDEEVKSEGTEEKKEENKPEEEKYTYEKRKKYTKIDLVVKETTLLEPKPLTAADRQEARKRRASIEDFERLKRDIAGLRNKIESAVYDVRSVLLEEEQYKPYYTKDDKTKLNAFVDEIEDWLSGESDDVNQEKYTQFSGKHQSLKNLIDPVYERYHENSRREKAVDRCEQLFNQTRNMLEQTRRNNPWVPELDITEVLQLTREMEQWVRETLDKQGRTPLSEAPIALAAEFKEKCEKPLAAAVRLFKRPKPKVETVKNETTTESPKSETAEAKTGESKTGESKEGESKNEESKEGETKTEEPKEQQKDEL